MTDDAETRHSHYVHNLNTDDLMIYEMIYIPVDHLIKNTSKIDHNQITFILCLHTHTHIKKKYSSSYLRSSKY